MEMGVCGEMTPQTHLYVRLLQMTQVQHPTPAHNLL